jgi:hypothetical protein
MGIAGAPITAAGAGGAAAAAMIQAIKASGAIVRVEPHAFMSIVSRQESPLIVIKEGGTGLFSGKYQYITSYKGLAFHTKSADPLQFTGSPELIVAKSIWVPG